MGGTRLGITYIPRDMEAMWEGGETMRFHTCKMIREDTVGHHSYGVACVMMHVYPDAPAHLLRACLKHDMAEAFTGDMPAPAKRGLGIREQFAAFEEQHLAAVGIPPEPLEPWEAWLLKCCDSIDGLRITIRERAMGNQLIEFAHMNFQKYVSELLAMATGGCPGPIFQKAEALFWALEREWEHVTK